MNYNQMDIAFYGKEKMDFSNIFPNQRGYLLEWERKEGVGGYAIYRKLLARDGWELVVTLDDYVTRFQDSKPPTENVYEYEIYGIIEGDFILGDPDTAGGIDFALTEDYESARQDMTNRIRTQKGDWRSHPGIGSDLELLEGEKNTRETGERGEEQIREALTYDGRFLDQDLSIRAVPVSIEQIDFYTMVDTNDKEPIIIRTPAEL